MSFARSENSTDIKAGAQPVRNSAPRARERRGFTLIELLIVLVLIGLSVSVVIPNVGSAIDKIKFRGEAKKLVELVRKIRFQAFYYQKNIVIAEKDGRLDIRGIVPDEPPPNLVCRIKEEIQFGSNGVSTGGEIILYYKNKAAARIVVADFSGQAKLEYA
jgi:prepilin-type N-terminal cleavage/methylation domain-containing protein